MPSPFMNFQPQGPGWNRPQYGSFLDPNHPGQGEMHRVSEQRGWSPGVVPGWPPATEIGGGMIKRRGSMNGMGDMFTYPEGTNPGQFLQQQIQAGAMPDPGAPPPLIVEPDRMDESYLFGGGATRPSEGKMAWESGPAPWETAASPAGMPGAVPPADAPAAIVAAGDAKAFQAAQAAKVASDNAARAARAGAPSVAATNAATAQAAASVAAQSAQSANGQRAAAVAASEATKAVAAANVAANNASRKSGGNGMGDWMELSGLGSYGLLQQRVPVLGVTYQTALMVAGAGWLGWWLWKKK